MSSFQQKKHLAGATQKDKGKTIQKEKKDTPLKEKDTSQKEKKDTPQKDKKDTPQKEKKDTPQKDQKDTPQKDQKDTPRKDGERQTPGKDKTASAQKDDEKDAQSKGAETGELAEMGAVGGIEKYGGGDESFVVDESQPTGSVDVRPKKKKSKKNRGKAKDINGEEIENKLASANSNVSNPSLPKPRQIEETPNEKYTYSLNKELVDLAERLCRTRYEAKATAETFGAKVRRNQELGLSEETVKELNIYLFPKLIHLEHLELIELLKRMWGSAEREYHQMVLEFLRHATVTIMRTAGTAEVFNLFRHFIVTRPDKKLVDELATKHLSVLSYLESADLWPLMDQWIEDESPWIRRAAILHQHGMGNLTEPKRLFSYCLKNLGENESKDDDITDEAIEIALKRYADTCNHPSKYRAVKGVQHFIKANLSSMTCRQKTALEKLRSDLKVKMAREKITRKERGA